MGADRTVGGCCRQSHRCRQLDSGRDALHLPIDYPLRTGEVRGRKAECPVQHVSPSVGRAGASVIQNLLRNIATLWPECRSWAEPDSVSARLGREGDGPSWESPWCSWFMVPAIAGRESFSHLGVAVAAIDRRYGPRLVRNRGLPPGSESNAGSVSRRVAARPSESGTNAFDWR